MTYRNGPSRREKWKGRVLKTPTLSHGTRLFLVHTLAKYMAADGFVSRPRYKLASEAGVSERQVARYTANAVAAGWLVLVGGGYRTMTSEYQAVFPNYGKGDNHVSHSEPEKGDANKHPFGVTNTSPFYAGKGDASRHPTSSSTTRAVWVSSTQSATPASSLRLSSRNGRGRQPNEWLSPRHLGYHAPTARTVASGAPLLSRLTSCKGDSRMRSVSARSKGKSAATEGVR